MYFLIGKTQSVQICSGIIVPDGKTTALIEQGYQVGAPHTVIVNRLDLNGNPVTKKDVFIAY
jgi:hypothetical protein